MYVYSKRVIYKGKEYITTVCYFEERNCSSHLKQSLFTATNYNDRAKQVAGFRCTNHYLRFRYLTSCIYIGPIQYVLFNNYALFSSSLILEHEEIITRIHHCL